MSAQTAGCPNDIIIMHSVQACKQVEQQLMHNQVHAHTCMHIRKDSQSLIPRSHYTS